MNEIYFYNERASQITKELNKKILFDFERSSPDRISTGIKLIDSMPGVSPGTLSKIFPRWAFIDKINKDGVPTEFTYVELENSVENTLETMYRGAKTSAIYYDEMEYGHHPPKNNLKATFEHNGQTILTVESKAAGTFPSEELRSRKVLTERMDMSTEAIHRLLKEPTYAIEQPKVVNGNRAERRKQAKLEKRRNKHGN